MTSRALEQQLTPEANRAALSERRLAWRIAGALAVVLAAAWVVGAEVYARLILPAPPLNFDEAAHSLPGYYVLRDILALDLRALWGDFHIQTLWPPGFSLLQAPFLGVLGRSDESARLFAYLMLVAAALVGFAVASEIAPARAAEAGLVSALIALSAPGWLFVGSWAMQETPVAFVSLVCFWLYLRAQRTGRLVEFAASSAALYFLFLTKFNYTAFALASVLLVQFVRTAGQVHSKGLSALRRAVAEWLALLLPFVGGVLFWFFGGTDIVPTEVKWRDFRFFITNEDSGYPFWSAENLLFYVRATLDWLMPSPWLALAAALGAGWAIARVRHPGVWLLAIFFGLGFVLATIHPLKANRYITPIFPALWLLTGLGAADFLTWLRHRLERTLRAALRAAQLVFWALVGALTLWSWLHWLPNLKPVWAGDAANDLRAAAAQIVRWQQPERPILIIGTFGELSPPLFEWRLRPLPGIGNAPHPIQYDAPPVEGESDLARVRRWLAEHPSAQVTVITLDERSVLYQTHDMRTKNAWRQALSHAFVRESGYQPLEVVEFPASGLQVRYYLPSAN
ncbi:MAG: hypothetical protein RML84_10780 [Anaerolineae bacterium]|nr:hypothetical protein [Anaerolineae bacterium]